jgi:Secretion system C-terminal sorting domain
MNRAILNLSLLIGTVVFPFAESYSQQWKQINGYSGPWINAFAVVPQGSGGANIFAGTTVNGVYLSTDNGKSWGQVNSGLESSDVTSFAFSGANLYAGTWGAGIFLSTDNGTTWASVNTGLTNTDVEAVAVSGANIFAGTTTALFLSTNNGTSWNAVNANYTNALAVSGSNVFALNTTGVVLSTDNGASWKSVNNGLPANAYVTALAASETDVFACTYGGGVYRSSDNGTTWTSLETDSTDRCYSLVVNGTNLFLGTEDLGVFLSTDNGTTWSGTNLTNTAIQAIAVSGTNFFAGTANAIFVSTDNGNTWTATNDGSTGLPDDAVQSIVFSDTNLFAASNDGVYLSMNNGTSWTPANSGLPGLVQCFADSGVNIFAGTNSGVFLSSNNGTTWMPVNSGLTNLNVQTLLVTGGNLYAGTLGGGVYLSTNNGAGWTADDSGLTDLNVTGLALGSAALFAATLNDGVFQSPLSAIRWTPCDSGITNTPVKALAASDSVVFAAMDTSIYFSTNSGANWSSADTGLPSDTHVRCFAIDSIGGAANFVFAGTNGKGVFVSIDTGKTWSGFNAGMSHTTVLSLIINNNTLFAATDRGVWTLALPDVITAVKRKPVGTPNRFSLSQNYPNPFNPTTKIKYQLSVNSFVTLKVYDILGREVARLVNERQNAGDYAVTFNAGSLSSGVYFYRLTAGGSAATKKLMLIK